MLTCDKHCKCDRGSWLRLPSRRQRSERALGSPVQQPVWGLVLAVGDRVLQEGFSSWLCGARCPPTPSVFWVCGWEAVLHSRAWRLLPT